MTWKNKIVGHDEVAPDQLLAHPENWRIHPKFQQEALRGVINDIGFIKSVTVNKRSGRVVDGHLRVTLALRDGIAKIPVEYVDLNDEEEAEALLTIDPIAALAGSDKANLETLLRQVNTDDENVMRLLEDTANDAGLDWGKPESVDAEPQIDRAAELAEKWQTKSGQLWKLGEHRLLIGDCTVRENVERLMGGERAGACVTDSPYGINREGIENDDPEGLRALFDGCLEVMPIDNGVIINFQSPRLFPVWLDAARSAGHKFERALWMYKSNDETFPWRGWIMSSEIIVLSSIGNPEWIDVHPYSHDCYVYKHDEDLKGLEGIHTTVKPTLIIQDLISRVGGDVYEPFGGSGTTMVACNNLGRKCRMIEIDPKYGAVILQRMSDLGVTPILAE